MSTSTETGPPAVHAELNRKAGQIEIRFGFHKPTLLKVKSVPGAKFKPPHKGGPFWYAPVDTTTVRRLKEAFSDEPERLTLGPVLKAWGRVTVTKETELRSLSTADDAKLVRLPKVLPELAKFINESDPARPYQRADIVYMAKSNCINANDPGGGKTIETIGGIYEGGLEKGAKLVVCPKTSLDSVWLKELTRFGQKQPVFIMSGDDEPEDRQAMLDEAYELAAEDKDFWFCTTAASIRYIPDPALKDARERGELFPAYPELFDIIWNVVVFDEYHKMGLSNPKSNLFRAANRLEAERRFLLSGTPMGGKPIKLWGGLHFLDPERFTSKWRWADEWLEIEEDEYEQQGETKTSRKIHGVREGREDDFWAHLAPYMIRRTLGEMFPGLAEPVRIEVDCELTKRQLKQYETMALNAEIAIEEEHLTATGILAQYTRLKQFADSYCRVRKTGQGKYIVKPTNESGKLPQVMRILSEHGIDPGDIDEAVEGGQKCVITSQFVGVADMVHEYLVAQKINAIRLGGSKAVRTEQVRSFQEDEDVRVIVMTTLMGGVSITLTRATFGICLDETWDPDDQSQWEKRFYGRGKMDPVTVYYLRSKDTIEQYIKELVQGKANLNRDILDLRRMGLRATTAKTSKGRKAAA